MANYRSEYLHTLEERGFLHQLTDAEGLDAALRNQALVAYIGFDCTAPSLHVGSLLQIMLLRHFQKAGHKPIVLIGGGTTLIGDPSGRDESRKLLTPEDISTNTAAIRSIFDGFLEFGDGPSDAVMVNNYDWLGDLDYIGFLRDVGRNFTVNKMLGFESVRRRLEREQPLTFLEFNYMILQAYDFVELYRRLGCTMQMGGSDQWGNIVNGIDLGRRLEAAELFGLTSPLITLADGEKMGKTAAGAVWLNEEALSSYDYWQYWRNVDDRDVGRFLRLFTELDLDEIARLEALEGEEINQAKKVLADEATRLCRGGAAAATAAETARQTFEKGGLDDNLPSITLRRDDLAAGKPLVDLYVEAGLASSKKEARRLIEQGGARIDGALVEAVDQVIVADNFGLGDRLKLSAGRKRHALVKLARS
ncbi:MAG: tyrosine--tRNA ligase [Proteobacteria bacterium]|nr:tyrosine--tRNA ligase [Pseudomonadota bacterium]